MIKEILNLLIKKKQISFAGCNSTEIKFALGVVDLAKADLKCADLRGVDLYGQRLVWADLTGANLHGADLRHANLQWVKLDGANLSEANLKGVENLTAAQLEKAIVDHTTKLPDHITLQDIASAQIQRPNNVVPLLSRKRNP